MGSKTNGHEQRVINHFLRNTSYAAPAQTYIGLFTVAPTDSSAGTEMSGNDYARVAVTWSDPSSPPSQNSGVITFPRANGGTWGTPVAWGVFSALSAGDLFYYGDVTANEVRDGDQITFGIGAFQITED
jgi:hypothetical protein